ncbi:MAG: site-2 protease family protein [Dehalococcoidia bacterium]|nr:site-2 protease family protein [Dehalococcoidia bacterium]
MGGKSIPLGRIFGIAFCINPSWLIIFIVVTWTLVAGYYSSIYPDWPLAAKLSAGVITSLLFFASVLAHELMHCFMALCRGVKVKSITLFIFGGVAEIATEPKKASDEFVMAVAGPLTSLALGAALMGLWFVLRGFDGLGGCIGVGAYWLGWINLSLGIYNMVPGFPLDGGRVLRSILWGRSGDLHRATRIASIVGRIVAYGLIIVGVLYIAFTGDWFSGVWFALIGWFLAGAAESSYKYVQINELLAEYKVSDAMRYDCIIISPDIDVDCLIREYAGSHGQQCFVVMRGDRLEGVLAFDSMRTLVRNARNKQTVAELMTPVERLQCVNPDDDLARVLNIMREEGLTQVPVIQDGRIAGVVDIERLQLFINMQTVRK